MPRLAFKNHVDASLFGGPPCCMRSVYGYFWPLGTLLTRLSKRVASFSMFVEDWRIRVPARAL
jgi:hypothetical protein